MRGSWHDKAIREFKIGKGGMRMGRPFRNVTGILAGAPVHVSPNDVERVWGQFNADSARAEEAEAARDPNFQDRRKIREPATPESE
jgi:hypothetical protein